MSIEKKGKTLHLLKSGSKPIAYKKKRKIVPRLGTFSEYQDSKKKPVAQPPQQQINIDSLLIPPTNVSQ